MLRSTTVCRRRPVSRRSAGERNGRRQPSDRSCRALGRVRRSRKGADNRLSFALGMSVRRCRDCNVAFRDRGRAPNAARGWIRCARRPKGVEASSDALLSVTACWTAQRWRAGATRPPTRQPGPTQLGLFPGVNANRLGRLRQSLGAGKSTVAANLALASRQTGCAASSSTRHLLPVDGTHAGISFGGHSRDWQVFLSPLRITGGCMSMGFSRAPRTRLMIWRGPYWC